MINIAILGCGQIGSRHLQALALLQESAEITLFDASEESLRVAQERFEQVTDDQARARMPLTPITRLEKLPQELDVAIIATGSAHRADLCRALTANNRVRYLILEKFLFQRRDDYTSVATVLREHGVKAWVNQWTSSVHAFRRIIDWLGGNGPLTMSVTGRGWGLCCNAVHWIELFDWATKRRKLRLTGAEFDEQALPSKRPGYLEICGSMSIATAGDDALTLRCSEGEPESAIHLVFRRGNRCVTGVLRIDRIECHFEKDGTSQAEIFPIPMQSRLTHHFVQELVLAGACSLPDLGQSSQQHLLVLPAFHAHFARLDPTLGDVCPIT